MQRVNIYLYAGWPKKCVFFFSPSGDNEYLLGASPTSLDAIVFGYVATVAKIPFPNAPLHQHLVNKCPNLIDYMERIINVYFPECVPAVSLGSIHGGRDDNVDSFILKILMPLQ